MEKRIRKMNKRFYIILLIGFFYLLSCNRNDIEDISFPECKCFIETATDSYTYPIRPRSEEWKAFTSSEEMVEATQIPYSLLKNMSTIGIYEACAENPLGLDLYFSMEPQKFYDSSLKTFNAWRELISRHDVASVLIKRYSTMCPNCVENNYSNFSGKGGDVQYAFVAIELFLAQETVLSNASKSECLFLGELITKVYKNSIKNNQSKFFKLFPVWIASRIMAKYDYSEFIKLKSENEQISFFEKNGIPLLKVNSDYTEDDIFQDIMEKFKSFLNGES